MERTNELIPGRGDAQAIIDVAVLSSKPDELDDDGKLISVVVPAGGSHHLIDVEAELERHQDTPPRARGTYKTATVRAFIDFAGRHEGDGSTLTVWVHPTSGKIVAVLNDHEAGQGAQWGDHRVELALVVTEEWKRWAGQDGHLLDQEAFAEHIQDGLTEIASPPGAELLEIAQTMQGSVGVSWKSGVRLADGAVQIGYTEQADATAGRDASLAIPTEFTLLIAPFVGEQYVELTAHLRWRVKSGQLKIGYKLDNPERVIREALEGIAVRLGDEFPGHVFLGEPRTAS